MPVVTVTAPPPADEVLVGAVAEAVARELGLGAGGVIATLVMSATTAVSGGGAALPWPVVTIHGSDRGADPMRRARDAAERAVSVWADAVGLPLGGIWAEWTLPGSGTQPDAPPR